MQRSSVGCGICGVAQAVNAPGCCKFATGSNPGPAPHGGPFGLSNSDEEIFKRALTTAGEIIRMLYE